MDTMQELRQVLGELALPAGNQLARFLRPDEAVQGLKQRYESAHAKAGICERRDLSPELRQALDELFLWLTGNWGFEEGFADQPPIDSSTDDFLEESNLWEDIRRQAAHALSLFGENATS